MRALAVIVVSFLIATPSPVQSFGMEPGPKSPAESLKCIQVRPGFTVELMAAEPLVMDPIAFAWGPDGKFWVVEMGDYPLGVDGKGKFGGKVKFLTKPQPARVGDGDDGPYTQATTFLDNLGYPTGVTPWGKGVIITCAPDIFYAEDTDGDGKADTKIVMFTGFREGNQQHRVNGLVWGLDNWLYGANGDSGGIVTAVNALERQSDGSHRARKLEAKPGVNISGRDFRLKPDTGEFEAVTGQSQFGRCRDDFGNWFGCNNSNPMFHFVLEDRYLKRNPHVIYPDPKVNVSVTPGAAKVYPISKPLPRFNTPGAVNHFTSACSVMIYRDNLFGPEFYGNSFVAEPVHNLIHREIMKPKGVTFTSQRADDEQTSEFLASSDVWFRPTMIATGPDGALWIADMYRYVIEHPEWIPLDWQRKLELRAGHDKGRIYRVVPKDKKPRAIPRVDKMDAQELVKALESPNGWVRDMAQQLLVTSGEAFGKARMGLTMLTRTPTMPAAARVAALYARHDNGRRDILTDLMMLFGDDHAEVRRHAMRCADESERLLNVPNRYHTVPEDIHDPNAAVRLQLALSLGYWRDGGGLLARLLRADKDDRYIAAAALSSVNKTNWRDFNAQMTGRAPLPAHLLPSLAKLSTLFGDPKGNVSLWANQIVSLAKESPAEQMVSLASLLDVVDQSKSSLRALADDPNQADVLAHVTRVFAAARTIATDPAAGLGDKVLAIRLLGRGLDRVNEDRKLLATFLTPQMPEDIQGAAVQRLAGILDPRVPDQLITPWKSLSPTVRAQAMDAMLSRVEWTRLAIEAIEQKRILPTEIDTIRRQKLLDHRDPEIRKAAAKLLAAASSPDRAKIVNDYWLTLPANGDSQAGGKLFAKHCAACHQLGGIGQQVGPDFAAIGDKSPQGLLTAILDPNRAIEARYVSYSASTKAGLTFNGLLQSETSTTLTLVAADGKKYDLLRKDLDELTSTGKSVMPEGFEKDIPPKDMADLLAFLRGNLAKPKTFPGNRPETVNAGADGSLKLLATNASIYGKTLVFEDKHQNLGYWSSDDDQASWTIEVAKEGRYDVWIDYACETAGNIFVLTIGDARLTHKVAGTASWDLYRKVKIGSVRLAAGRCDAIMRAEGVVRGALIDLKGIHLELAKD